jgi:dTDP-4-dehydrorhamnose 3,5-epimerase
MKILDVKRLSLPEIKVLRYGRFLDSRGFFTEHFRRSDFVAHPELHCIGDTDFLQCNESYSKAGAVRGLHFQWNPYMGKLVRTVHGRMVDLVLDIRKGSPNFGKIIGYDMPAEYDTDYGEWIWVPPGFAHGNFYTRDSHIEYFCSGEYSPGCEAGISPLAGDLDWTWFPPDLKKELDAILSSTPLITDKDRNAYSLASWVENPDSERFKYDKR